jgi:hypothetical protein
LFDSGALAGAFAHEVQLRAADLTVAFHNDLVDARRAEQEGTFHTDAIRRHAADGHRGIVAAVSQANDQALELLNTLAFTFLDFDVDADGVTSSNWGIFSLSCASTAFKRSAISVLPYFMIGFHYTRGRIIARIFWIHKPVQEYFRTASTALCPPKPNALLSASETFASRALLGT